MSFMPTLKQRAAIEKVMENHGNVSRAMLEVGYDPTTAKNPKNLTDSKGWHELLEKYIPDIDLLEVHKNGLQATKIHTSHTEPDVVVPDFPTQAKFLELGYKVKNKYNEPVGNTNNILVLPAELMNKYGITSNTETGSTR